MQGIRLVAFDMDGVVLDSMPALTQIGKDVLQEFYGFSAEDAEEQYNRTVGHPFAKQLEMIFPAIRVGGRLDALSAYHHRHYQMAPEFPLAPMLPTALASLKLRAIRIALVSSTGAEIIRERCQHLLKYGFDFIGGYNGIHDKAAQLGMIAYLANVPSNRILLFGDSDQDQVFAQEAGTKFFKTEASRLFQDVRTLWDLP